ncbi:hypothetical protein BKA70DRAFT_1235438 [Coprinopsis sp. MPI-PUGE-AT-0042]|nr:hypothetical protein BKA70DRAFT_1235438 [Coprinopsis sp. MPI-PUGE-AT-0042]
MAYWDGLLKFYAIGENGYSYRHTSERSHGPVIMKVLATGERPSSPKLVEEFIVPPLLISPIPHGEPDMHATIFGFSGCQRRVLAEAARTVLRYSQTWFPNSRFAIVSRGRRCASQRGNGIQTLGVTIRKKSPSAKWRRMEEKGLQSLHVLGSDDALSDSKQPSIEKLESPSLAPVRLLGQRLKVATFKACKTSSSVFSTFPRTVDRAKESGKAGKGKRSKMDLAWQWLQAFDVSIARNRDGGGYHSAPNGRGDHPTLPLDL